MQWERKRERMGWSPFRRRLLAFHQPSHLSNYMAFWVGFVTAMLMTWAFVNQNSKPINPHPSMVDSATVHLPAMPSLSVHNISELLTQLSKLEGPIIPQGPLPWEPPRESDSSAINSPILSQTPYDPKVPNGRVPPIEKKIHQTWKTHTLPDGTEQHTATWKVMNPGYRYKLWDDYEVEKHMKKFHPEMMETWAQMKPIEKADTFRYAILLDEGGVYSDIDVSCSRPIDEWGQNTNDFRNFDLMVGFEVVTQRPDWAQWYARKFQVCQWTIAGRSGHPVFRRVLDKIIDFFKEHDAAERSTMSVVQSTGPGIWSDAVLEYFDEEYQAIFAETDYISEALLKFGPDKSRENTLHIGSALMLPVRAFAMNSGGYSSRPEHKSGDMFAQHYFQGSWKNKPGGGPAPADPTSRSPCYRHPIKSHELICGFSQSPPTEKALYAMDSNLDTKWLANADFNGGINFDLAPKLLYTACASVDYKIYEKCLEPDDGSATTVMVTASRYAITVAGDYPERDPSEWTLEGRRFFSSESEWIMLDNRTDVTWEHRFETRMFEIEVPDFYSSFRLTILNTTVDSVGSTQIAEFWLENRPELPPTTCSILHLIANVSDETNNSTNATNSSNLFSYPFPIECCAYTSKALRSDPQPATVVLDKKLATEYTFEFLPGTELNFSVSNPDGIEMYSYMIGTGTDAAKDPIGWILYGQMMDGPEDAWLVLDEYDNHTFDKRSSAEWFNIPVHFAGIRFTDIRLSFPADSNDEVYKLQVSEIEIAGLVDYEVEIVTTTPPPTPPASCTWLPSDAASVQEVICYKGYPDCPQAESPPNAFDGDIDTKWLGYFVDEGQMVPIEESRAPQISYSLLRENGTFFDTFNASYYAITSANDAPDRDPTAWTMQCADELGEWSELDNETDVSWTSRKETKYFPISDPRSCVSYRFVVLQTAAQTSPSSPVPRSVQISELWLDQRPQPTAPICIRLLRPLLVESPTSNVSSLPAWNSSGLIELQACGHWTKSIRSELSDAASILDRNFSTQYSFETIPGSDVNFTFLNTTGLPLERYLIGVGNNETSDPIEWELYGLTELPGSNDSTWILLDSRTDYPFPKRSNGIWFYLPKKLAGAHYSSVQMKMRGGYEFTLSDLQIGRNSTRRLFDSVRRSKTGRRIRNTSKQTKKKVYFSSSTLTQKVYSNSTAVQHKVHSNNSAANHKMHSNSSAANHKIHSNSLAANHKMHSGSSAARKYHPKGNQKPHTDPKGSQNSHSHPKGNPKSHAHPKGNQKSQAHSKSDQNSHPKGNSKRKSIS